MGCKSVPTRTGIIPEDAAPAAPAAPPVLVAPGVLNFIALNFGALDLSDGSRIAEDNVELQWNRGLLGFALVALFGHFSIRFLHCVWTICKITI